MNTLPQNKANHIDLAAPMPVGGVALRNRVLLAPMSGVSDLPFRERAWAAGAGAVISEMVASRGFCDDSPESRLRAERGTLPQHIVQLAGRDPYWMGEAARIAEQAGAAIVDINFGCPAKKVTGAQCGSALMREPALALKLVEAAVSAVSVPVTVKMRLGWDYASINAPQIARDAQNAGAQMITVHGRTRCQFYEGRADWEAVAAVRDAIRVPLVVNGDIASRDDAIAALAQSGADAVMVGRACYGAPWRAGEIAGVGVEPGPDDICDYVAGHHAALLAHYGEAIGLRVARKHLGWYADRFAPATTRANALRGILLTGRDVRAVQVAIRELFAVRRPISRMADAA